MGIARKAACPIRPRVEGAREDEILDATLDLLAEVGYDRLTMDGVAARAKASKATLYRRWDGKPDLVVDALLRTRDALQVTPCDTGNLRDDLVQSACGAGGLTSERTSRLMAGVVTALHHDEEFAAAFRSRLLAPKIAAMTTIFERARERGEISDDVDLALLAPALAGIVLHRTFVLGEPGDRDIVERVVDQIIVPAATAPRTARSRP